MENEKKRLKLYVALILMLIVILDAVVLLAVCRKNNKTDNTTDNSEKSYASELQRGEALIEIMNDNISNDVYRKAIAYNDKVEEIADKIAGMDYDKLLAVYNVKNFTELVNISASSYGIDFNTKSDNLRKRLEYQAVAYFANIINAQLEGEVALVVSQGNGYGYPYIDSEKNSHSAYVYVYEDSYPVMVTFAVRGEGIVEINGAYLIGDSLINLSEQELTYALSNPMVLILEKVK